MSQRAPPVVELVKLPCYKGTQSMNTEQQSAAQDPPGLNTEQPSVPQDPHGLSPDPLSGSPHEVPNSVGSEFSESQKMPNFRVEIKEETSEEGLQCEIEVKEEFPGPEQTEDSFFAERGTDLFGSAGFSAPSEAVQSVDPQASTSYPRSQTDTEPHFLTPDTQSGISPCQLNPPLQNEASHSEGDPLSIYDPLSQDAPRSCRSDAQSQNSPPEILTPNISSPVFRSPVLAPGSSHRTREVSRTRLPSELCSDVAPNFPQSAISSPTPNLEPPGLSGPVISIPNYLIVLPANMPENGSDSLSRNVPNITSVGSKRKREADGKYQCEFCHVTFEEECELHIHTAAVHCQVPGDSDRGAVHEECSAEETAASKSAHIQYVCQVCFRAFLTVFELDVHLEIHQDEQDNSPGTEQHSKTVKTHGRPETSGTAEPFTCHFCSRVFELELEWKMHLNVYHTVHKISNADPNEEESSNSRPNVAVPKSTKKGEKKVAPKRKGAPIPDTRVWDKHSYQCNQCTATFHTLKKFNMHLIDLHSDVNRQDMGEQVRSSDQANSVTVKGKCRHICKFCKGTYASELVLSRHISSFHVQQNGSSQSKVPRRIKPKLKQEQSMPDSNLKHQFFCEFCTRDFNTNEILNIHKTAVHGDKKVLRRLDQPRERRKPCFLCSEDCDTAAALKNHLIAVHSRRAGGTWGCTRCQALYTDPHLLWEHMEQAHRM